MTADAVVETVYQSFAEKTLLLEDHLMDAGYVTAERISNSETNYDIDLMGSVRGNSSWQSQKNSKFTADQF
ncbi:hypothetical protein H6F90_00630 [Trichocoleus sp. FACHB-591]|uniref:hypothetical protein n=1 Tax=Trichocoleus TaxID=450526 RepID=UPI0016862B1E|nr:hypothetical protein [Trichocoleus sp. FACHB-591]MBD2093660.1 hypothetical protein [Trichocoleus sp. FACHB-591]